MQQYVQLQWEVTTWQSLRYLMKDLRIKGGRGKGNCREKWWGGGDKEIRERQRQSRRQIFSVYYLAARSWQPKVSINVLAVLPALGMWLLLETYTDSKPKRVILAQTSGSLQCLERRNSFYFSRDLIWIQALKTKSVLRMRAEMEELHPSPQPTLKDTCRFSGCAYNMLMFL